MTPTSKIGELEERIKKLESAVFKEGSTIGPALVPERPAVRLSDLSVPTEIISAVHGRIRKVSYWNLVLTMLSFSQGPLKIRDMMNISNEFKKPIPYEWFNTDFHRKKYSGLVRSETVSGSPEKVYRLNEPGRRRADTFIASLKTANK